jgi:predicted phosphoadenosine phosphosulfate sulfurtransferase
LENAWQALLKDKALRDIWRCMYKCNIAFHVVDKLIWQAMITSVAKLRIDDFQESTQRNSFNSFILLLINIEPPKASW